MFWEIPAVRPGGMYGISYIFVLPYPGKVTLNQPIELPVTSLGALLPVTGTLKLESPSLANTGPSDFGGASYYVYTGENLAAGTQLAIKISGTAGKSASQSVAGISRSRFGLIVGLGAFGLALILAGVWISRRNRPDVAADKVEIAEGEEDSLPESQPEQKADTSADAEALMDDIIALDDLYQAGELPEAAYRERRAELKEKLRAIVGDDD
jgi:hypothetical protein